MSPPKKPLFINRIRKVDLGKFKNKIEAIMAPRPKLSSVNTAPPIAEAGYRSLFQLATLKRQSALAAEIHATVVAKYEERLDEKASLIHTLESKLLAAEAECKTVYQSLLKSREEEYKAQLRIDAGEDEFADISWKLAQANVSLSEERAAHLGSKRAAEAEAVRLLASSDLLQAEYLAASKNLKTTRNELVKTRQDAVDLQREVNYTRELLELERLRASQLEEDKATMEGDHAKALLEAENKRGQLTVELAVAQKELDNAREKLESEKVLLEASLRTAGKKAAEEQKEFERFLQMVDNDINALSNQLLEKDAAFFEIRDMLEATEDKAVGRHADFDSALKMAYDKVEMLTAQLIDKDCALSGLHGELSIAQEKALEAQAHLDSTLQLANNKIGTLSAETIQKDTALSDVQTELAFTQDSLKAARHQIETLTAQLATMDNGFTDTQAELVDTRVALKVAEKKAANDKATYEYELEVATDEIKALAAQLVEKDATISDLQVSLAVTQGEVSVANEKILAEEAKHEIDAKELSGARDAASKNAVEFKACNEALTAHVSALKAQLESITIVPSSGVGATAIMEEGLLSFHTRRANTSNNLKATIAKIKALEAGSPTDTVQLKRPGYGFRRNRVQAMIENLENKQIEESIKPSEESAIINIGICNSLKREDRGQNARGSSQSTLATLSPSRGSVLGSPLSTTDV